MQNAQASDGDDAEAPGLSEIQEQIERIRSSSEFHAPRRGRRFLDYVVEETLAGRAEYLKAYTIAQEVFARDASFDAQNDPVVRIEAGRIRRALERYYLVAGQGDPVIITIPKGGYVPCFRHAHPNGNPVTGTNDEAEQPSATLANEPGPRPAGEHRRGPPKLAWIWYAIAATAALVLLGFAAYLPLAMHLNSQQSGPTYSALQSAGLPKILVEPFEDISGVGPSADIARGLTDEVISHLAKFKEIIVVARMPAEQASLPGAGEPRFALQGHVRLEGDQLRLIARFINRSDGSVIWASNYDRDVRVQNILEIEAEIAQRVATALAQPYGVIFQTDTAHVAETPPDDWDAYACTLSYYSYRADLNPESHAAVQQCLQRATERLPRYSTIWALLSLTYLDELRFQYKLDVSPSADPLARAAEAARRAVELDPQNARALQALMLASFFSGNVDEALSAGAQAYALNPNDTEVAGEYGFRLALSGRWETGCELMSSAVNRISGPRGYYEVGMAVCAYMRNDYQAAELWVRMADLRYNPIHHLVLLAVLGAEGRMDAARQEINWLKAHAPSLMTNIRKEVTTRLSRPEDQERFFAGLRSAGMVIPPE